MNSSDSFENKNFSSPLFLFGSGRSGTTLLQRILNSHDDICIWGEHGGFLKDVARAYFSFQEKDNQNFIIIKNKTEPGFAPIMKRIKDPVNWSAWDNWFGQKSMENNFRSFLESFFRPEGLAAKFWGFKEIRYGRDDSVLEFLVKIFPEAKFIFVVRNPLDVILSQISMFYNCDKKNFVNMARDWSFQNSKFFEFQENNPDKAIFVKHEDLISDNNGALKKIFSFLGLNLYPKQLDVVFFDGGRGADVRMAHRPQMLEEKELDLVKDITRETALKFFYKI